MLSFNRIMVATVASALLLNRCAATILERGKQGKHSDPSSTDLATPPVATNAPPLPTNPSATMNGTAPTTAGGAMTPVAGGPGGDGSNTLTDMSTGKCNCKCPAPQICPAVSPTPPPQFASAVSPASTSPPGNNTTPTGGCAALSGGSHLGGVLAAAISALLL